MIGVFSGSRHWTDVATVEKAFALFDRRTDTIVEGGHRVYETLGVPSRREMYRTDVSLDAIVADLGLSMGFDVVTFWAPWSRLGNYAGPWRNEKMLTWAQAMGEVVVEAFPLPDSKGTVNMIALAKERGVPYRTWDPVLRD